jgi:hypothetical protein
MNVSNHKDSKTASEKNRILLLRLDEEDLKKASGGIFVQVVVTHANMKVSVEDDTRSPVKHKRVELLDKEPGRE